MSQNTVYLLILVSLLFTYFALKRIGKMGCHSFGYVFLIVTFLNAFTVFSLGFLQTSLQEVYTVIVSGDSYNAKVIDRIEDRKGSKGLKYKPNFSQNT